MPLKLPWRLLVREKGTEGSTSGLGGTCWHTWGVNRHDVNRYGQLRIWDRAKQAYTRAVGGGGPASAPTPIRAIVHVLALALANFGFIREMGVHAVAPRRGSVLDRVELLQIQRSALDGVEFWIWRSSKLVSKKVVVARVVRHVSDEESWG